MQTIFEKKNKHVSSLNFFFNNPRARKGSQRVSECMRKKRGAPGFVLGRETPSLGSEAVSLASLRVSGPGINIQRRREESQACLAGWKGIL